MATIKVKRSAVAGRVPATADLELGEIAINTYDGVAYVKKSVSGTETVVQLGSANLSQNLQNRYQYTATTAQTTFSAVYLAPYVDVYLNGIRLIAGVDYTATNGTTVVLTTAASLNNTIDIVAYTSYTANANFADLISSHVTTALGYTPENPANKGVANGYASLNSSGQVPSAQLPSFVDDVVEYANLAALPATGETGKIYVTLDTNKTYRWSGSAYVEIASSPGSTDAVTEGSSNLYFTNARARNALSATQNLSYSSSTGVFTGPDLSGYLTSASAATVYAPLASPSFTGSVLVNTGTGYGKFTVQNGAGTGKVLLDNYATVPTTENVMSIYADATNGYIQSYNNGYKNISIGPFGGNLLVGATTGSGYKMRIQDNALQLRLQTETNANLNVSLGYSYSGDYGQINCDESGVNQKDLWYTALNHRFGRNTSIQYMTLNASGNLGIGTNDPTSLLHISANATATIQLDSLNSGRGNFYIQSKVVGNTNWFQIGEDTGGDFFTILSDNNGQGGGAGNVGIGTSSPLGKLHLSTSGDLAARKTYSGLGNTGAGDGIFEAYRLDGPLDYLRVLDIVSLGDSVNNRGSETRFFTTNTSGVTAERVKIDSSGNVGIGTSTPSSSNKVQIHVTPGAPTTGDPAASQFLSIHGATATVGQGPSLAFMNLSGAKETGWRISAVTASGNNGDLTFHGYNGGGDYPERLRITAAGAVGFNGANYGTTGQVLTSQGSGSAPIWAAAGGSSQWTTNGTQINYTAGNVGIGTTDPRGTVQIGSGNGGGNVPSSSKLVFGANNSVVTFLSANDGTSTDGEIGAWNTVYNFQNSKIAFNKPAGNLGHLSFHTNNGEGIVERMRIDSAGKINLTGGGIPADAKVIIESNNFTTSPQKSLSITRGYHVHPGTDNNYYGLHSLIRGFDQNNQFTSAAVYGETECQGSAGVIGKAFSITGPGYGVAGIINGNTDGYGIGSSFWAKYVRSGTGTNGGWNGYYCEDPNYHSTGQNTVGFHWNSLYTGGNTKYIAQFTRNGTSVGNILCSTTTTSYNTSSDYRLKENIVPLTGALERVARMKPVTYKWKADQTSGEGFIAHELAEVLPLAVTGTKDETRYEEYVITPEVIASITTIPAELDADGNEITPERQEKVVTTPAVMGNRVLPVYQGVDTSFLVATLVAAIQELKSEFDAYKASHP